MTDSGNIPPRDPSLRDLYSQALKNKAAPLPTEENSPSFISLSHIQKRYTQFSLIAEGGIKQIFNVFDEHSHRHVALAMPRDELDVENIDPFIHEAWLTAILAHPNIINVHDVGVIDRRKPFFTMDLKKGDNLDALIKKNTRSREELLDIFLKVCDAIAYAHNRQVLHLDLKPHNIQVENFGEVLVCDWGLGQLLESGDAAEELKLDPDIINNVTLSGAIKGTPGFMAPEQIDSDSILTPQADIYSLGCTLYYMLTGQKPFSGTPGEILTDTKQGRFIPQKKRAPMRKIPNGPAQTALKAMQLNPSDRYSSVLELQQDIRRYLNNYPTRAERAGFLKKTLLFYKRNHVRCLIATVSIIAIILLSSFFIRALERSKSRIEQEHELATKHEKEADRAQQLYVDEMHLSHQNQEAHLAALQFLISRYMYDDIFFVRPITALKSAESYIREGRQIAPEKALMIHYEIVLHFIKLDFNAIYELQGDQLPFYKTYCSMLTEIKSLQPQTSEHIPEVEVFNEILKRMTHTSQDKHMLIEQMIAYDHARRQDRTHYEQVILTALNYFNRNWSDPVFEYNQDLKSLVLGGKQFNTLKSQPWRIQCMLHYLPIKQLHLLVDHNFALEEIKMLPLQELNLTDSEKLNLAPLHNFRNLDRLIINDGVYSDSELSQCHESIIIDLVGPGGR
ncbi:serine/threonine protein kinase [Pontiella sulfatireligans]|uniref:Serine/threonine-protein kinase PknD n=1 Tax=Pontiella sulfatireligans TaxID=2750658 RepID=A0A6C2ULJ1_9BACT|nr:serine/threonine-protein kinase [Pontiella sulfatireligans]VGO20839.1 Serine/threonine-protein kinase PknD [Pontiella sulfatireligans]